MRASENLSPQSSAILARHPSPRPFCPLFSHPYPPFVPVAAVFGRLPSSRPFCPRRGHVWPPFLPLSRGIEGVCRDRSSRPSPRLSPFAVSVATSHTKKTKNIWTHQKIPLPLHRQNRTTRQ